MTRRFSAPWLQSETAHSTRGPTVEPVITRGARTREVDVGIIGLLIVLILIVILLQLIL